MKGPLSEIATLSSPLQKPKQPMILNSGGKIQIEQLSYCKSINKTRHILSILTPPSPKDRQHYTVLAYIRCLKCVSDSNHFYCAYFLENFEVLTWWNRLFGYSDKLNFDQISFPFWTET